MTKKKSLFVAFCLLFCWLTACGLVPHFRRSNDFEALRQKAAKVDSINCSKNWSKEQRQQALLNLYQHSDIVRFATINRYKALFVWFDEPYYKERGNFIDLPECKFYTSSHDSLPQNK